jgi:hypothetical protein
MCPKVGVVEKTKGKEKEGIHHICAGTRHKETLKTVKQHRMGKKGEEVQWRGVTLT